MGDPEDDEEEEEEEEEKKGEEEEEEEENDGEEDEVPWNVNSRTRISISGRTTPDSCIGRIFRPESSENLFQENACVPFFSRRCILVPARAECVTCGYRGGPMTYFVEGLSGHTEPETRVRRIGEYDSLPDAIAAAKRLVDGYLRREYKPGMEPRSLISRYQEQGEHPYIFRDDDTTFNVPGFNHLHYATARSSDVCAGKK
jgi:hypothetical protein